MLAEVDIGEGTLIGERVEEGGSHESLVGEGFGAVSFEGFVDLWAEGVFAEKIDEGIDGGSGALVRILAAGPAGSGGFGVAEFEEVAGVDGGGDEGADGSEGGEVFGGFVWEGESERGINDDE